MDSSSLRGYLERGRSKEAIDCSGYHMWSWYASEGVRILDS